MKLVAVCTFAACVAFVAMTSLACGKKTDERSAATTTSSATATNGRATCNMIPVAGKCDEYGKEDPLGMARSLCEGFKGTYSMAACPQDGLVGTCVMKGEDRKRYYVTKDEPTSFSADDARKDCENDLVQGKFTPVANPPKKPAVAPSSSASAASPATQGGVPASPKRR
jgi:hypothetical protein